jgi:hypothetical protein
MQRRAFVSGGLALSAGIMLPKPVYASQQCNQPVMTPYGPIQRCTAGIQSFSFQQAYQEQDEWCWASCISMVFGYYGHPVSQRRIVAEVWGEVVDMPGEPDQILSDLNRNWTDDRGRRFTSRGDSFSANNFNAVKDLQNDQPLIVGALGHATVLTALTADSNLRTGAWQIVEAVVRDPWPSNGGRRVLSPTEWFNINFAARVRVA